MSTDDPSTAETAGASDANRRRPAPTIDLAANERPAAPGPVPRSGGIGRLIGAAIGPLICGWMIHSRDGSPMKMAPHPALAAGKVSHVGDAYAVVIAETLAQAKDAAEKVVTDFEVLPAVIDPAQAQARARRRSTTSRPTTPSTTGISAIRTANDAAMKTAKHVTRLDFINNRLVPNAIEPRAAIAEYDAGGEHFTLWTTSQNPHVARLVISAFIGVAPEHKLRVIAPDVGGGFGSKIFIYPEEVVCLWASKKVARPVKWTADRSEAFVTDAHGRDHVTHAELGFDENNKIVGMKVKTIANLGAYMSTFSSAVPTYLYATLLSGQYDIPSIYCEVDSVYTNTVPVDAYRGAGRPEATFVVERLIEVAARELGLDPADLRKKNFVRTFPYQTVVASLYDAGDYEASLSKAMEIHDVKGFKQAQARERQARQAARHRLFDLYRGLRDRAVGGGRLARRRRGPVGIRRGAGQPDRLGRSPDRLAMQHGQGHETTFAQLVSERLGIPIDNVTIVHGDTDKVQFGMGTYGSRSGAVGMSAIVKALDKVEAKAKKIAAHLLEAAEGDIEFKDGKFSVAGTDKSIGFGDLALQAYVGHKFPTSEIEPGLKEGAFYDPTNFTFPAGCHICEVEIDPDTGAVEIAKWTAVDDFGTIINPMIVEGQVHGGIAQGVGQALLNTRSTTRTAS